MIARRRAPDHDSDPPRRSSLTSGLATLGILADHPVTTLRGVGPSLGGKLADYGVYSVEDLLYHLPLRYQDRTRVTPIAALVEGADVVVEGEVKLADIAYGRRRSLVVLFTDMFQEQVEEERLFESLRHLKYNKHEVILFHLTDRKTELDFSFDNTPRRFTDVESGARIDLYPENVRESYQKALQEYLKSIRLMCGKYGIKYFPVDIAEPFARVINTFLVERQRFA